MTDLRNGDPSLAVSSHGLPTEEHLLSSLRRLKSPRLVRNVLADLARVDEVLRYEGPAGLMSRAARKSIGSVIWCERVGFYDADIFQAGLGLRPSQVAVSHLVAKPEELLGRFSATLEADFGLQPQEIMRRFASSHVPLVSLHQGKMIAMVWVAFNAQKVPEISRTMVLRSGEFLTYNEFTLPDWRGLGISPHLNQFAHEFAKQHGERRRINWRLLGNSPAVRVANKLGDRLFAVVTTVRFIGVDQALVFGLNSAELVPLLR